VRHGPPMLPGHLPLAAGDLLRRNPAAPPPLFSFSLSQGPNCNGLKPSRVLSAKETIPFQFFSSEL